MRLARAILFTLLCGHAFAQQPATNAAMRFEAVDIFIETRDKPLAAYQLEFAITNGVAKIVGLEGGEPAAFREAPFYDPKAIQHERVIIAAFNTSSPAPSGRTRVATIHLQVSGELPKEFEVKLQVSADGRGNKIPAIASAQKRKAT